MEQTEATRSELHAITEVLDFFIEKSKITEAYFLAYRSN